VISIHDLILCKLRNRTNLFCLPGYKAILDTVVQTNKFIPKTGKVFRKEFAINIVEKDNAGEKGKAGITIVENKVMPVKH